MCAKLGIRIAGKAVSRDFMDEIQIHGKKSNTGSAQDGKSFMFGGIGNDRNLKPD